MSKRKWYAETVAEMFVMEANGHNKDKIAAFYGISRACLNTVFTNAKKYGYDAYPPRGK